MLLFVEAPLLAAEMAYLPLVMTASLLFVAPLLLMVGAVPPLIVYFPHCSGSPVPGDVVTPAAVASLLVLVALPSVSVCFLMVQAPLFLATLSPLGRASLLLQVASLLLGVA